MIRARNLWKVFGPRPGEALERARADAEATARSAGHVVALRDVSFDVEAGQTFVVMGLSGSGKSTLLRHLNRLVEPTAGSIEIDGTDILGLAPESLVEFRRHRTAMVFQGFGLLPHRSVLDNVAYGLAVRGIDRSEREERARTWIRRVGLEGTETDRPHVLSGGMQQRVGLARALATEAPLLLMDEPFSALDPVTRREMQDRLRALEEQYARTIVFITHDLDEAVRVGDRIAILRDGALVQTASPDELVLAPADAEIARFVRDVPRGRVLTARSIMVPAGAVTAGAEVAPGTPLDEVMARALTSEGPLRVVEDDRTLGIVRRDDLARALAPDAYLGPPST